MELEHTEKKKSKKILILLLISIALIIISIGSALLIIFGSSGKKSKKELPNLSMNTPSIEHLEIGYSAQDSICTMSIKNIPEDYSGTITYTISQNIMNNGLLIYDDKLSMPNGFGCGKYPYQIAIKANADKIYNGKNFIYNGVIVVDKFNPTGSVWVSPWTETIVNYGYTTQPSAQLSISGGAYDGTVTYSVSNTTDFEISGTTIKLKTGKNAGFHTTTIDATVTAGTNYNSGTFTTSGSQRIIVNRINSSGTVTVGAWSATSVDYGYTTQPSAQLSISGVAYDGTITYTASNTTDFEISGTTLKLKLGRDASTTAYTTTVSATVTAGTNYNSGTFTTSGSQSITVNKINSLGIVTVGAWSTTTPTYGYTTQPSAPLSISGSSYDGTITYTASNTTDFEIDGTTLKLKTGKNAGSYTTTVSASTTGGANYNAGSFTTSSSQSITVNKANPSGTVAFGNWSTMVPVYGYATQPSAPLSINGGAYDGTVTYSVSNTIDFEIDGATLKLKLGRNANASMTAYTTTINATVTAGTNYSSGNFTSVSRSISVALFPFGGGTVTVGTWSATTVTYGYTTQPSAPLSITTSFTYDGTVTYSVSNTTDFEIDGTTLKLKTGRDASTTAYTTTVSATVTAGTNYSGGTFTTSSSQSITVNKANPSGTVTAGSWSPTTLTYYGYTTQPSASLSISGSSYDGTITYSVSNTNFEISGSTLKLKTGKNAGIYSTTVSASTTGGTNYNSGTFTTSSSISITVWPADSGGTLNIVVDGNTNPTDILKYFSTSDIELPISQNGGPSISYLQGSTSWSIVNGPSQISLSSSGTKRLIVAAGTTRGTYNVQLKAQNTYTNYLPLSKTISLNIHIAEPIPTMTSYNSPVPYIATASSAYSSDYSSYKAFDNNDSTYWCNANSGDTTASLMISLGVGYAGKLVYMTLLGGSGATYYGPQKYTLSGSNDNNTWTSIDINQNLPQAGISSSFGTPDNLPPAYTYFRLDLTGNSNGWIGIATWELYIV